MLSIALTLGKRQGAPCTGQQSVAGLLCVYTHKTIPLVPVLQREDQVITVNVGHFKRLTKAVWVCSGEDSLRGEMLKSFLPF